MKIGNLPEIRETGMKKLQPDKPYIAVGMGTCGIGNGADEVYRAFAEILARKKSDINLKKAGCFENSSGNIRRTFACGVGR